MCLSVFCACLSALCVPGACGHQKGMKSPLGLEFRMFVSCHMGPRN